MFVGHAALALMAKPAAPRTSLATLFAATFGLDLLWPIFSLMGIEWFQVAPGITAFTPLDFQHYPWSHSLMMALVWGVLAAFVMARVTGRGRDGAIVGALVASHWPLDAIVHRPDLPLWPGPSPLVGLGLWHSVAGTILVEGLLWGAGLAVYFRSTASTHRVGSIAAISLFVLMTLIWATSPFQPPPPTPGVVTATAFAVVLLLLWAGWADRHRTVRAGTPRPSPP